MQSARENIMSDVTNIEWCDSTFNPFIGCTKVGPGCDNCYAEKLMDHRMHKVKWGTGHQRIRTSTANWAKPLAWNKRAAAFMAEHGRRQRVFCASLADVFDNSVDPQWRVDLFALIEATPDLDWILLTKRIGNVAEMVPQPWVSYKTDREGNTSERAGWPTNVWMGATIVNQTEADRDVMKLLDLPAPVRFLSMEPLLGPVDLSARYLAMKCGGRYPFSGVSCTHQTKLIDLLDWIIVGGESGAGARPMHPDWARDLRDQCQAANVPFLFKQWGEHSLAYDRDRDDPDWRSCDRVARKPGRWINLFGGHGFHGDRVHYAEKVGKKAAGRLLDGAQHDGFPGIST